MKLILVILLFIYIPVNARVFYLSKDGNDYYTGRSPIESWLTLNKINSFIFNFGDSILFNRGDTFYGYIRISSNGLYFGSYGNGAKPVINGFTTVTGWKNLGSNIFQSSFRVSNLLKCNMVAINGKNTQMGRWPNMHYNYYTGRSANSGISGDSITAKISDSINLTSTSNWTGAQIVIRMSRYSIDRNYIYNQRNDTLYYSSNDTLSRLRAGFGYFIQNSLSCLDTINEWYYNKTSGEIYVYNTSTPTGVRVASIDTLFNCNDHNNITVKGIDFQGANSISFHSDGNNNSLTNSNINFSGLWGIKLGSKSNNFIASYDTIYNSNDAGIVNDSSKYITISDNQIKYTGVYAGMGSNFIYQFPDAFPTWSMKMAVRSLGAYATITGNIIDTVGYMGIYFYGDSVLVKNNYINYFGFVMDDGGGIYSYSNIYNKVWKIRNIINNIVLNGIGAQDGCSYEEGYTNETACIYLDAAGGYFNLQGNTVYNANKGIFLNNSHDVTIENNTLYNNFYNLYAYNYSATIQMSNIVFKHNILLNYPDTFPADFWTRHVNMYWLVQHDSTNIPSGFVTDSNYYYNQDYYFWVYPSLGKLAYYKLPSWRALTKQDIHSLIMPDSVENRAIPLFYYNSSKKSSKIYLSGDYVDTKGTPVINSITLQPFTSVILYKKSSH